MPDDLRPGLSVERLNEIERTIADGWAVGNIAAAELLAEVKMVWQQRARLLEIVDTRCAHHLPMIPASTIRDVFGVPVGDEETDDDR